MFIYFWDITISLKRYIKKSLTFNFIQQLNIIQPFFFLKLLKNNYYWYFDLNNFYLNLLLLLFLLSDIFFFCICYYYYWCLSLFDNNSDDIFFLNIYSIWFDDKLLNKNCVCLFNDEEVQWVCLFICCCCYCWL